MTIALVVLHVAVSLTLILLILLHAGRGGGVSEMFGGGMQSSAMGSTVMEKNLDRITVIRSRFFSMTVEPIAELCIPPPNISETPPPRPA